MSTNPPQQIQVRPTSAHTAECDPLILRITDSVRLVFKPVIVNNPKSPDASIDGHFVWERKRPSDKWEEISNQRLTNLSSGQGYRLTLRAQEVLDFYKGLSNLYELHQQKGVPKRRGTFVNIKDGAIAEFLAKGEPELSRFFNAQREDDAAKLLLNLLGWLAQSSNGTEAVRRLVSTTPERLPQLTALLGLSSLKDGIEFYRQNKNNPKEEFWQQELSKRSYLFSQVFSYPIVIIREKAYLGGKHFDYRGGYIADFVGKVSATDSVILIEIKTPQTTILGSKYREGV